MKCSNMFTGRIFITLASLAIGGGVVMLPARYAVAETLIEASTNADQQGCPQLDPDADVAALGIVFTPPSTPTGQYIPAVRVGKLMFLSGNVPRLSNESFITGKLGLKLGQLTLDVG